MAASTRERMVLVMLGHPEGITVAKLTTELEMTSRAGYNRINLLLNQMLREERVTRLDSPLADRRMKLWRLQGAVCEKCGRGWK